MSICWEIISEGDFDLTADLPGPVTSWFKNARQRIPSDVPIKFFDDTLNVGLWSMFYCFIIILLHGNSLGLGNERMNRRKKENEHSPLDNNTTRKKNIGVFQMANHCWILCTMITMISIKMLYYRNTLISE